MPHEGSSKGEHKTPEPQIRCSRLGPNAVCHFLEKLNKSSKMLPSGPPPSRLCGTFFEPFSKKLLKVSKAPPQSATKPRTWTPRVSKWNPRVPKWCHNQPHGCPNCTRVLQKTPGVTQGLLNVIQIRAKSGTRRTKRQASKRPSIQASIPPVSEVGGRGGSL